MKTEFEIVFWLVDHGEVREKIKQLWGVCMKEKTLMKRVVFENPINIEHSFVRIRDEWDKITTTYKQVSDKAEDIQAVQEIDVEVGSFEAMKWIYTQLWMRQKAYQETYREVWKIDNCVECMLDEWPWLNPFIEIEAESEDIVREYTSKLGFNYEDWVFGCVDELYLKERWIEKKILNSMKEITFENFWNK